MVERSPEGATTTVDVKRSSGRIKLSANEAPADVPTHKHGDILVSIKTPSYPNELKYRKQ